MSTSKNRRLAAILFADIVGYTAMMQSDEGQTMSRLRHYQKILQKEVANFRGEIIKNYGDGSLCIFSSVLDAVLCAKSIQEQLQQAPKVPLRIGLHLGDVLYEGNDIYGNALNIASRIESLGVAGSVLFSKNIQEKVKNQQALQMQSLGNFEFKNVEEPLEVFALANTGSLIMGITGDENWMDATTISDSVNSAARIESLTKYYGTSILLSEVSLKKIVNPDEFHFRYLGKVQVKGKQKLLKIYECFDGEPSDIFNLKLGTLDTFNTGIQHYFKQAFSQAIENFEKVLHHHPADMTAQLFLHKARQLAEMGVAENWTGVELMMQK